MKLVKAIQKEQRHARRKRKGAKGKRRRYWAGYLDGLRRARRILAKAPSIQGLTFDVVHIPAPAVDVKSEWRVDGEQVVNPTETTLVNAAPPPQPSITPEEAFGNPGVRLTHHARTQNLETASHIPSGGRGRRRRGSRPRPRLRARSARDISPVVCGYRSLAITPGRLAPPSVLALWRPALRSRVLPRHYR